MDDYPKFSRMPGSDVGQAEADFDRGEVIGMRSAGIAFLLSAVIGLAAWLVAHTGLSPAIVVQLFLGVQMLRLQHSWRSWAMLGAAVGVLLGAGMSANHLVSQNGMPAGVISGLGVMFWNTSVLLFLVGNPSTSRVLGGRVLFGVALVLSIISIVLVTPST
jgi:hypothetical protein